MNLNFDFCHNAEIFLPCRAIVSIPLSYDYALRNFRTTPDPEQLFAVRLIVGNARQVRSALLAV